MKTRKFMGAIFLHVIFASIGQSQNDDVLQFFRSNGAKAREKNQRVYLDVTSYQGKKSELLKIRQIKGSVRLKIDIGRQSELFDMLPQCKLTTLNIVDQFSAQPPNDEQRAKMNLAMQHVCNCKTLLSLQMECAVGDDGLKSIDKLANLISVSLPRNATDKTLAKLGRLKQLRIISFYGCWKVTGIGFEDFEINHLITSMDFSQTGFKSENVQYLNKFPNLSVIRMFQHCRNEDICAVSNFPAITEIYSDNSLVNDNVFDMLANAKLKMLSLHNCAITDEAVPKINKLTKLETFSCGYNFLTEDGYTAIKIPKRSPSSTFFEPSGDKELKTIQNMIDRNYAIKPYIHGSGVSITLHPDFENELINLEDVAVKSIVLQTAPSRKTLAEIMKLNNDVEIYITLPTVQPDLVSTLKSRFKKVRVK